VQVSSSANVDVFVILSEMFITYLFTQHKNIISKTFLPVPSWKKCIE